MRIITKLKHWMFGYEVILICAGTSSSEGWRRRGVFNWRFRKEERLSYPPDKVLVDQMGNEHPCIEFHTETHIEFLGRYGQVIAHAPLKEVDGITGNIVQHPDFYKTLAGDNPDCPFS